MKLNIVTFLLFTLLLTAGFSAKSDAQEWRWRGYEHCSYSDTAFERNFEHWGRWGCAPRRYYRHMMWSCGDTAMCNRWCGRPYRWSRWENWKESDENFEKYEKEMESKWKNYHEEMMKEDKEFREHTGLDKWDGYEWRRYRHHWHDRYYYRGGGY